MEELKNVHYDAFISYRHCEPDSFIAKKIHSKLEAFKLPKAVRTKVKNGKTGIERVFKDEDELPMSDNLLDPIENALNNSDFLIIICSPRYLESRWCMKELEVFLKNHDREHILVVLADGEPENSFPKILTFDEVRTTDENGNTVITRREIEPLAADTRDENKKEVLKAIDIAVLKLSAEIFGLNYDDLKRRHRKQKIRRMTAIFGSIGAAILIFAVFAMIMFIKISGQKETISRQYDELQDRYASSMETVSEQLMGTGRRKEAAYALRGVLPDSDQDGYNSDALRSLYSVMDVYDITGKNLPQNIYEMESEIDSYGVSFDNRYIWISDGYSIIVFDIESGRTVKEVERKADSDPEWFKAAFCGSEGLIVLNGDEIDYCSLSGNEVKPLEDIGLYSDFVEASDGTATFVVYDGIISCIDNKGSLLYSIDLEDEFDYDDYSLASSSSDNGNVMMCFLSDRDGYVILFDGKTGEVLFSVRDEEVMGISGFISGDKIYYSESGFFRQDGYNVTSIAVYDYVNSQYDWVRKISNIFTDNIIASENNLYIIDETMILVLDRYYGDTKNFYYLENPLIACWCRGDRLYFINFDNEVHYCDDYLLYDYTKYFYVNAPSSKVISAIRINEDLFCLFSQTNYIVYYSADKNDCIKTDFETEDVYGEKKTADEELKKIIGEDQKRVRESLYSDDQKYIVALFSDHTIKIYDTVSMSEVNWFETDFDTLVDMRYSTLANCYVLSGRYNSVLLNGKFEKICNTNRIVGEKDGNFIMADNTSTYYSVPVIDYNELIRRTDVYLNGYEPSEAVKQKYNLK